MYARLSFVAVSVLLPASTRNLSAQSLRTSSGNFAIFAAIRLASSRVIRWADARTKHVEAGILLSFPLAFQVSKQVGELAIAKRLPLISLFGEFPKMAA
jgi:hypothetical protein